MSKLIICRGLPASGKTTWATYMERNAPDRVIRVNKDDIRRATGEPWSRELEKRVVATRDQMIRAALLVYEIVISDDTNLAPKHEKQMRQIAMESNSEVEIEVFDTGYAECIARDAKRVGNEKVGERVIMEMYNQFLKPAVAPIAMQPYIKDQSLPPALICDLDGTLALHNGRSPYDFTKCYTDLPNGPILTLLWAMANGGVQIIYLSGRDDSVQAMTETWLSANGCPPGPLFMRVTGDKRKDSIMKLELFDREIRGKFNVLFALDDRDQIVKLWRDLGLTCLQVAYGNF